MTTQQRAEIDSEWAEIQRRQHKWNKVLWWIMAVATAAELCESLDSELTMPDRVALLVSGIICVWLAAISFHSILRQHTAPHQ